MVEIEKLFDKAVAEIERMLNTKTVVGEPITIEGTTLIPLVNVGFGFGVGGGEGTEPQKGTGKGGGTGGGGGVTIPGSAGSAPTRLAVPQAGQSQRAATGSLEQLAIGGGDLVGVDGGEEIFPQGRVQLLVVAGVGRQRLPAALVGVEIEEGLDHATRCLAVRRHRAGRPAHLRHHAG